MFKSSIFRKNIKYITTISFTLLLLLLNSCSFSSRASKEPTWYLNPPKNDYTYLYGVGEGYNLETATQSALKNLSSKILVTISSETNLMREETNFYANEQIIQNIQENVEKITFNNYEVDKTSKKRDILYVIVKVNRAQFIKDKKLELSKINEEIRNIDSVSINQSILERRNALEKINKISEDGDLLVKVIGAVDPSFNKNAHFQKYSGYKNEYNKISDKILVYIIKSTTTEKGVVTAYKNGLNKKGIKTVTIKNENNPNQVILDINSKTMKQEVYKNYMTKINISTSLKSNQGKSIKGRSIEVSGISVISEEQSLNTAIYNLEQKIAKEGIFSVLGLSE